MTALTAIATPTMAVTQTITVRWKFCRSITEVPFGGLQAAPTPFWGRYHAVR